MVHFTTNIQCSDALLMLHSTNIPEPGLSDVVTAERMPVAWAVVRHARAAVRRIRRRAHRCLLRAMLLPRFYIVSTCGYDANEGCQLTWPTMASVARQGIG
jgi:hypothetical protein